MDLLALGQAEAALPEMQLESLEGGKMAGLARIYHSMGRNADSDVALARVTHDAADIHAYEIAMAHADRGGNGSGVRVARTCLSTTGYRIGVPERRADCTKPKDR